jgi:hypothetical protein
MYHGNYNKMNNKQSQQLDKIQLDIVLTTEDVSVMM